VEAQLLEHPLAHARYWRRKAIIEPCFAELLERQELKRFHRRGLKAVRAEFALHCIAFNLNRTMHLLIIYFRARLGSGWHRRALFSRRHSYRVRGPLGGRRQNLPQ
jgi:hypothetical protein